MPEGFARDVANDGSFAEYLRNLPLKTHGSKVEYYDGREKSRSDVYCAVIDMPIGDKDLQQCADALMRLRGESRGYNIESMVCIGCKRENPDAGMDL